MIGEVPPPTNSPDGIPHRTGECQKQGNQWESPVPLNTNARWSKYIAREDQAAAARSAIFARLEREVDPMAHFCPTNAPSWSARQRSACPPV